MAQARRNQKAKSTAGSHAGYALREGGLFLLVAIAVYLLISLLSYHPGDPGWSYNETRGFVENAGGTFGAWFSDVFLNLFGYMAFLFPFMVAWSGWLVLHGRVPIIENWAVLGVRWVGFAITLLTGCGLAFMHFAKPIVSMPGNAGGILGDVLASSLSGVISPLGTTLLLFALFLGGFSLFTGLSWVRIMDQTGYWTLKGWDQVMIQVRRLQDYLTGLRAKQQREQVVQKEIKRTAKRKAPRIEPVVQKIDTSERAERDRQVPMFETKGDGTLPSTSLLKDPEQGESLFSNESLEAMSRQVELKLADFGVEVEVEAVYPGPVITRFELRPAPGIKVSRITNLDKDLARSLSVNSVRVVEVIPGKSVIGLEIPNEQREMVSLSEIIKSKEYDRESSPLTMALGKDVAGQPVVGDLQKMPHLLVAGTTGSGKSVAVNAMILSILFKASPAEVRMIMIDPKMLELSVYEGIPHLLTEVVTDMKEASNALRWCVGQMDDRYRLMAALGVRGIGGYNRKVQEAIDAGKPMPDPLYDAAKALDPTAEPPTLQPLPYIVVVVDELADMMMVVGKKVEELIARLAQKARACGIHLILATQRPSVDVITGLIKANIPSRIAFQVSSRIDSRTILDQMGAETLLGQGDMLYLPGGSNIPTRVHGAFVDDHEVHEVVAELKKQGGAEYIEGITGEQPDSMGPGSAPGGGSDEDDPLYDEAVRIVTETRRASISGVQRRLKIGYNRAARMIEAMEMAGVVSAAQSNGSREVLAPPPPDA